MRRLAPLLLLVLALAVTACGGGEGSPSSGGGGSTLKVDADPDGALKFAQGALTAKAGKVTIDFTNASSLPHDVKIEQDGKQLGGTPVVTNKDATAEVELEAGDYTYYCSVPGHREAGMEGELTVQ